MTMRMHAFLATQRGGWLAIAVVTALAVLLISVINRYISYGLTSWVAVIAVFVGALVVARWLNRLRRDAISDPGDR
jgi:hypothetical protein